MVAIVSVGKLRRSALSLVLPILLSVGFTVPLAAQVHIDCVSCTTYAVSVTPDGTARTRSINTSGLRDTFTVTNQGTNNSEVYDLVCNTTGVVASCTPDLTTVSVTAGQSKKVGVTYSVTTGLGVLQLRATGETGDDIDAGSFNVSATTAGAPTNVALRNHNRDNRDRSLCLTAGAGEAAGYECGDLFVVHGMPGYSTLGRDRSLSLIYNSAGAFPVVTVAAAIKEDSARTRPDTVFAQLLADTGTGFFVKDSAKYGGWAGTSPTRQIVLGWDASASTSGIYLIRLDITNRYLSSGSYTTSITDTVMVLNRKNSDYGAGWFPEGIEQLKLNQPVGVVGGADILWMGGDGSTKWYRKVAGQSKWVAPKGVYQDTLVYSASQYVRTLRHGISVTFDNLGQHIRTTNRALQSTMIAWSGNHITTVKVPPGGAARTTYTFTYMSGSNKLDKITDPVGRVLDATLDGSGRLTGLLDPDDTTATTFGYDSSNRLTSRTNRRGVATNYSYVTGLSRLTQMAAPGTAALSDTTVYQPWDSQGWASAIGGLTAVDTALAYTKILGPRTGVADDASFWVDRWGAPVKIVNALNQTTLLTRDSTSGTPALISKVVGIDNRISLMAYDARGNLTQLRDSTAHLTNGSATAVTIWGYHSPNTQDSPDSLVDPLGLTFRYRYNTLGLDSLAIAPNGHMTSFEYKPSTDSLHGLLIAVAEKSVPTWNDTTHTKPAIDLRTQFSFNLLGNVTQDSSTGGRIHSLVRDTLERVTSAYDPAGHRTEYVLDLANRIQTIRVHAESAGIRDTIAYPADSAGVPLETRYFYTHGLLDSIWDPRTVYHGYQYDPAGRISAEYDESHNPDTFWYNAAGQVDSMQRRTGAKIRNSYDAGGRLLYMSWPRGASLRDSIGYGYDAANRTSRIFRKDTVIARLFNPTGTLRTEWDSLHLLSVIQRDYYDIGGRRTAHVVDGGFGSPGVSTDSVRYVYDGSSGDLRWIAVHWRTQHNGELTPDDSVRLSWDALGRRDSVNFPHVGAKLQYAYDANGSLRMLCAGGATGYSYTQYNDLVDLDGLVRRTPGSSPPAVTSPLGCTGGSSVDTATVSMAYDVRHQMLMQQKGGAIIDYRYDASGNRTRAWQRGGIGVARTESMNARHNRVWSGTDDVNSDITIAFVYNLDGSRNREDDTFQGNVTTVRGFSYDSLGRTLSISESGGYTGVCSYDPLNRLMRSCDINGNPPVALIYDGANVVRAAQNDTAHAVAGWSFVQGPGTDDPLLAYYPFTKVHAYYMTDGAGRQYAVLDANGLRVDTTSAYGNDGGQYGGATAASGTFGANRPIGAGAAGVSYFRNRIYDQTTGRFTQEDPAGVAGGVNLYEYSGNSPANFTDPFGLCPPVSDCIAKAWGGIKSAATAVGDYVGSHPEIGAALIVAAEGGGDEEEEVAEEIGAVQIGQAAEATEAEAGGPGFVVNSKGTAIPVPEGATGPTPVVNSAGKTTGFAYSGGKGGQNGQVSTVRIMGPTPPRGRSPGYPNGYVKYENDNKQGVDPNSGRTVPQSQSHLPLP